MQTYKVGKKIFLIHPNQMIYRGLGEGGIGGGSRGRGGHSVLGLSGFAHFYKVSMKEHI